MAVQSTDRDNTQNSTREIDEARVGHLAEHEAVRDVFATAVDDGPSVTLRRDLDHALIEAGYDTRHLTDTDLRDLLLEGCGYMQREVEAVFEDLNDVEHSIAFAERLKRDAREKRDEIDDEYHALVRAMNYNVRTEGPQSDE
jgi:hypothetical protein